MQSGIFSYSMASGGGLGDGSEPLGMGGFAQAQEEFKYGAVMPVTGPIPQHGEYFIRGSQLALEDIEKSGWIEGKKIRISLEDGKNDPKLSLAAMNKLISIDKVPIVETVGSPVMLALGPVAQGEQCHPDECGRAESFSPEAGQLYIQPGSPG